MARPNCRVIFYFAKAKHADKVTQQLSEPFFSVLCNQQQLIVKFQVPHCCFSFSHYTQCSLTVSSAVARQVTSCSLDSTRSRTAQVYGSAPSPWSSSHALLSGCHCSLLAVVWPHSAFSAPLTPQSGSACG